MLANPAVSAVNLSSTSWSDSFISYLESSGLGTDGYTIPVGSSSQLQTLPWININQIRITFTENVNISESALTVSGVNTVCYSFSSFSYDSSTHTATWTLSAALTKDKILLDLDADGLSAVRSSSTGNVLDGAWTNCQSIFNSGNGTDGTDFEFRINILPADCDSTNATNATDALAVANKRGTSAGDSNYSIRCDVDGSGTITTSDVTAVQSRICCTLPSGDPVGVSDDAPTTSGITNVSVAVNAVDHVFSLTNFFADNETSANLLTYSIASNSNSSIFDSVSIDSSKNLTLNFAASVTGSATITVQCTDPSGLFIQTTFNVYISHAPYVGNFCCVNEYGDHWTITGTVSDADDSVEGYVVTFGGVLASYSLTAVVDSSGVFSITVELINLSSGTATAQTEDPNGVLSALATDWIAA
jgi:hypothetical protein